MRKTEIMSKTNTRINRMHYFGTGVVEHLLENPNPKHEDDFFSEFYQIFLNIPTAHNEPFDVRLISDENKSVSFELTSEGCRRTTCENHTNLMTDDGEKAHIAEVFFVPTGDGFIQIVTEQGLKARIEWTKEGEKFLMKDFDGRSAWYDPKTTIVEEIATLREFKVSEQIRSVRDEIHQIFEAEGVGSDPLEDSLQESDQLKSLFSKLSSLTDEYNTHYHTGDKSLMLNLLTPKDIKD